MANSPRFLDACHVQGPAGPLLWFAGNDYHRLSFEPRVREALLEGLNRFGMNASGSRVTCGESPIYAELERALSKFLAVEEVALVPSGYLANAAAFEALGRPMSAVVAPNSHPSWSLAAPNATHWDGSSLLEKVLLADGLEANTGKLLAWDLIIASKPRVIIVDQAHAFGTVGSEGRGGAPSSVESVQTGTLSKAFGVFGGFVAGSSSVVSRVRTCNVFRGSTPISPALAAAGLEAVRFLSENCHLIDLLQERARRAKEVLVGTKFEQTPGDAPIISIATEDVATKGKVEGELLALAICPNFIHYPGAPASGHQRFTVSSAHNDEEFRVFLEFLQRISAL